MRKTMLVLVFVITMSLLTACGSETYNLDTQVVPVGTIDVSSDLDGYVAKTDLGKVFSDPDGYTDEHVIMTGKVFSEVEEGDGIIAFQIWADPINYEKNVIVYASEGLDLKEDDYVIVDGIVKGDFTGENAFGGEISAPIVVAERIEETDYMNAIVPAVYTYDTTISVEHFDVTVSVNSIEFAEDETRLYLKVDNQSDDIFNTSTYDIKIVQDGKQISQDDFCDSAYEGDYADLDYELNKNASTEGIVVFPKIDYSKPFTVYVSGYSDNYYIDIPDFELTYQPE